MTTATQTFNSSGTFTAPATLLNGSVKLAVAGERGHAAPAPAGGNGGNGAYIIGNYAMSPGGTLTCTIGYHAGGAGGVGLAGGGGNSGATGGKSAAVLHSGVLQIESPGGGGEGGYSGGPSLGGNGGIGGLSPGGGQNGGGGFGGGAANGANGTGGAPNGANGSSGTGGAGGAGSGTGAGGGGGGGGFYGGGGGGSGTAGTGGGGAGGGGGYAYVSGSVTGVTVLDGWGGGAASVVVTYTYADAPLAPTLGTPNNGAYVDVSTGSPVLLNFTVNPGTDSGALSAYALRVKVAGGTYVYWNAGAGTLTSTTPVWNACSAGTTQVSIPAAKFSTGTTYQWSIATQESDYSLQGPFASDRTFNAITAPTLVLTAPPAIVNTAAPVISWTETLGGGDSQTAYQVKVYTQAQSVLGGFDPAATPNPAYDSGLVSSAALTATVGSALTNGVTYVAYVRITETGGLPSAWTSATFTVQFDGPDIPSLAAAAGTDPNTGCPITTLTATSNDNLLSAADSSFEATVGTWVGTGATRVSSSAWAEDQSYSLLVTATGNAASTVSMPTGLSATPVPASSILTLMATARQASLGQNASLKYTFYDASGTIIGVQTTLVTAACTSGGTFLSGQVTSPSNAAFVSIAVTVATTTTGQTWNLDETGVFTGTSSVWSLGGYANLTTTVHEFQYSDDQVNWFDVRNGGSVQQGVSAIDYESPFNQPRYYRARAQGLFSGQPVYSNWSPVTSTTLASNRYWFVDPLNPGLDGNGFPGAIPIYRTSSRTGSTASGVRLSHEVQQIEQQGQYPVFGRPNAVLVRGDMYSENFDMATWFGSLADWENFDRLRLRRVTLCMRSDLPGKIHYAAIGSSRPRDIYSGVSRNKPDSISEAIIQCIPQDVP
jgi:hypothetical protein